VHWYTLHRAKHRSHVRTVVIDGATGYTGGSGFDDKWITTAEARAWQDAVARFTGPAVRSLQAVFAAGWAEATGELLTGEQFYPPAGPPTAQADTAKRAIAGALFSTPAVGATAAERALAFTVGSARRTLHIVNPYFLPGPGLRGQLKRAAQRGVDVRIITAGDRNDVGILRAASRATYEDLLEAGVHIYEYLPTLNHSKTIVVDGVWATVGTLNLDARSLRLNEETTLLVHDSATAASFETEFGKDLRESRAVTLEEFRRRSVLRRARERLSLLLAPLL
jgi:cardiolipin synthase